MRYYCMYTLLNALLCYIYVIKWVFITCALCITHTLYIHVDKLYIYAVKVTTHQSPHTTPHHSSLLLTTLTTTTHHTHNHNSTHSQLPHNSPLTTHNSPLFTQRTMLFSCSIALLCFKVFAFTLFARLQVCLNPGLRVRLFFCRCKAWFLWENLRD